MVKKISASAKSKPRMAGTLRRVTLPTCKIAQVSAKVHRTMRSAGQIWMARRPNNSEEI